MFALMLELGDNLKDVIITIVLLVALLLFMAMMG